MRALCLALLAAVSAVAATSSPEPSAVWVSSHDGSDDNPGTSAVSPLRSVAAGLRAVARHRATALHIEGQHSLNETIRINANRVPGLLIDSWPGRPPPTLSGAAAVPRSAWVRDADHFSAPIMDSAIAQALLSEAAIYVGDRKSRRTMVRTATLHWKSPLPPPNEKRGFVYNETDLDPTWALDALSLRRWRVNVHHSWATAWHSVASVDAETHTILFQEDSPFPFGTEAYCAQGRWSIEGVPELPLVPGTWRISLDGSSGSTTLHYRPAPAETFPATVYVPVVPQLIEVAAQRATASVVLRNLQLELSASGPCSDRRGGTCSSDEAEDAYAAVQVSTSPHTIVQNLTLLDVGGYGLSVQGSSNCTIDRIAILGAGAGGVSLLRSDYSTVSNSWVRSFGRRQPAGVGVLMASSQHSVVEHCDISDGFFNGLAGGGTNNSGSYSTYRLNHVHSNGRESDDGICDFGGIHVANTGSTLPGPWITDNIFSNITSFANGGAGIYLDVSSVGMIVERNLAYDISYSGFHWNVNPGVTQPMSNPMTIRNNVFVLDRENEFYRRKGSLSNPAVTWHGHSPAFYEKNVHVINASTASSRGAWWGALPCAQNEKQLAGKPIPVRPQHRLFGFFEH